MQRIYINGIEHFVQSNTCLSDCLRNADFPLPCGGNGVCGKCKVYVKGHVSPITDAEKRILSSVEIDSGMRLACFTYVYGECWVERIYPTAVNICTDMVLVPAEECAAIKYAVAVDLGTTTVAAVLMDRHGRRLATATATNPQIAYGADVLSRAKAAANGKKAVLAAAIRDCLTELLDRLIVSADQEYEEVDAVVITGNTAMLCLLTETPVDSLLTAPFRCPRVFGETLPAKTLGFNRLKEDTVVYLPRCLDAFLGADFICSLLATDLFHYNHTALMLDIGTNCEMALWHEGMLYACSTAAGPAFEGVGISCGMMAGTGAIDRVDVVNHSLVPHVIDGGTALGICGSGLMDAVACLLNLEEIDQSGAMMSDVYDLADGVGLIRGDIQALLLAKSALRAGIDTLCRQAGIPVSEIEQVYLAGGFANSINLHSAVRIGMIPQVLENKTTFIGNAALSGATHMLFGADFTSLPPYCVVDLATNPFFAEAFIRNMTF